MIINDLDDYYIVFDTKNRNIELDTLIILSSIFTTTQVGSYGFSIETPK